MRPRSLSALILPWALLAGCTDSTTTVDVTQLERGGDIEFVCLCERADGSVGGARMDSCDPDEGDDECDPYLLLMQSNRGEIAVVDAIHRNLHDSDSRAPFTTFPQVGDFPSDMVVSADGARVWVVHMGEARLAQVQTSGLLGPVLPQTTFTDIPGKGYSITLADDDTHAFVSLPEQGALAVVDLSTDPPVVTTVLLQSGIVSPDPDPDAGSDTDSDADALSPDMPSDVDVEDTPADVPDDVPNDGGADIPGPPMPADFTPLEVKFVPGRGAMGRILVSGFDAEGSGGVMELDAEALISSAGDPLVAFYLSGTPVGDFDVAQVVPVEGADAGAPSGFYLYAADRDEAILHVVDMQTGEELDTTGGNPLVRGGGIRTDGLVQDVLVITFDNEEGIPEEYSEEDLDPTEWFGMFVFASTSAGVVHAVDLYDRFCWHLVDMGGATPCTPHVMRNALPGEDSTPYLADAPTLITAAGDSHSLTHCSVLYPCLADLEDTQGEDQTYGVTFYPDLPGDDIAPDIRRPRTEDWSFVWEGAIPWSTGIGGNLSEDGAMLTDPGVPFCGIGVRGTAAGYPGDVLVIDEGPSPLDDGTDCSQWPEDGGMAYRIVGATQTELRIEPVSQWDPEDVLVWLGDGGDRPAFPLPTEECFPFAVHYHIRASGQWIVTGSRTGFLHATALDTEGRCIDSMPACTSWEQYETARDCTLRTGRAQMDQPFLNPYIRFQIQGEPIEWGQDGGRPDDVMKPGLTMEVLATSGFVALSEWVSALPESLAYLEYLDTVFVSDRGYDGLVELDPGQFSVLYSYD